MRKLYLDDSRKPFPAWGFTVVRSFDEFVLDILTYGVPDLVSFDHDLADEHYNDYLSEENWKKNPGEEVLHYEDYKEKTGYHAAQWLANFCQNNEQLLPECYVHSDNIVGAQNIKSYLENYIKFVEENSDGRVQFARW